MATTPVAALKRLHRPGIEALVLLLNNPYEKVY
jgi:hypothetical protein